jgi:CO/xanthine dehydrogenase Mo-binding subunit
MGQFRIGQPVRRFEDRRLLCGNGRFQNDSSLPGQAWGTCCARRMRMPRSARLISTNVIQSL